MPTTEREDPKPPSWLRETGRSFLEFLGITGLAVAEPILSSFRKGADVFVLRHAAATDVVGFVAAVVLGPALVLLLFESLFSILGRSVRRVVHVILLAGAGGAVVLGTLRDRTSWGPTLLVLGAVAGVALVALAVVRWPAVRLWLRYLAAFPVVLGLAFLFASPVTDIVLGRDNVAAAADGVTVGDPAPVVMIVLDELPLVSLLDEDDHINAAQFPNLARLSGDATWFRNESSVAPSTPEAVPAILTGTYPTDPDALPDASTYPDNLFTLLGATYRENVWEGVTHLCPTDVCPEDNGGQGGGTLGGLIDDAADVWQRHVSLDRSASQVTFQVRQSNPNAPLTIQDFVDSMAASGDVPRLDFLHVLYPHQPWFHTPTGAIYEAPFVAEGLDSSYRWKDQAVADAGRQRHLLQLQHADAMVGRVLDRMEELGTYDESLVVLTADHGVSFEAGNPIRGLSSENYHQIMWTPLLVKEPRQTEGAIDDRPLSAVDVLPTIADVLDVDLPWDVDGRSAYGEPREDGARKFFEWTLNALQPTDGPYVEVDGPTGFQRMLDEPPPGEGARRDLRFYRFGEWGRLVGRDVEELTVDGGADRSGTLDRASAYQSVDRSTGEVPAYVSGTVRTTGSDVSTVLVTVNGTVAGWSHLHAGTVGAPDWYTMVPEWFFVDGANHLELYSVTGTPDDPVLHPISLT